MRILARRFGMTKVTVMNVVHRVVALIADPTAIAAALGPKWSGILAVDGKYVRVYDRLAGAFVPRRFARPGDGEHERPMPRHRAVWFCGIDCSTGDLPHYQMCEEETKVDLVLYFRGLQACGYALHALVSDGNPDIVAAARKVFGDSFVHQRCTKHFADGMVRLVRQEELPEKFDETMRLVRLIQSIVTASDIAVAARRRTVFPHMPNTTVVQKKITTTYLANEEALVAHLLYPEMGIPSTSNEIENLFRQLNLRLKSLGQFRHWRNAEKYLNAWALLRRLTKYTDCRGERKIRNGKSPLELAGVDVSAVDMFDLRSTNQQ